MGAKTKHLALPTTESQRQAEVALTLLFFVFPLSALPQHGNET